jgi:hypothetical protein
MSPIVRLRLPPVTLGLPQEVAFFPTTLVRGKWVYLGRQHVPVLSGVLAVTGRYQVALSCKCLIIEVCRGAARVMKGKQHRTLKRKDSLR